MVRASCIVLILCVLAALAPARAGLLDLLWGDAAPAGGQRGEGEGEGGEGDGKGGEQACRCAGAGCRCCYAALELGAGLSAGAGCVAMRYASPAEGLALNVSFGDSLLLQGAVRGARPPPLCLDLISDLAQLCARVGRLRPAADGLRWCLRLEPVLLGDARAVFPLGCFRVDANGMRVDEEANDGDDDNDAPAVTAAPATDSEPESEKETNSTEKPIYQLSEEELIAVVNQSAEEGIAFFSNLLGLTFGEDQASDSNSTEAVATSPESNSTSGSTDTEAPPTP